MSEKGTMSPKTMDKLRAFEKRLREGSSTVLEVAKDMRVGKNWYHSTKKRYKAYINGLSS